MKDIVYKASSLIKYWYITLDWYMPDKLKDDFKEDFQKLTRYMTLIDNFVDKHENNKFDESWSDSEDEWW